MEQREAEFGPHSAGSTSQAGAHVLAAAPAARCFSSAPRPLLPPPPQSTKPRRRSFVPPPSASAPPWPTAPAASRPTVPPHPRQTARTAPKTKAPARPRPTTSAPGRPTIAPPPRPMVDPAPQAMAPPLGLTSSLRQETPASVSHLRPQLCPDLPCPDEQLMFNPPLSTSTAWDSRDDINLTSTPILDWTADYSEPDPTPASIGKGPSKRGSNYGHDEDIQLCKSWLNITYDPVVGTDQSGKTYWERIAQDFHQNIYSERSTNSLEHRCGVILRDCMLFHSYFEEVQRERPSGVPEQEHLLHAQARYSKKTNGKTFPLIHCWLVVRHSEKFETLEMNKRSGKTRGLNPSTESNGSPQQNGGQQEPSIGQQDTSPTPKKARPPGRKQSKDKLKRGEGDDEYKTLMKNLMVIKNEEHTLRKERWTKDLCLEQQRLEIEERKLQWEQEKQIMFCDVNTLDKDQRIYVLAKRAQFAKMAAISSSGGGSVGESGDSSLV